MKEKKKGILLVVVADHETKVQLKELSKFLGFGNGNLRFGPEEQLLETLKITKGSVNPFGVFYDKENKVRLIIDKALENKSVLVHPMHNKGTVKISTQDVIKFCEKCNHTPQIVDFNEVNK